MKTVILGLTLAAASAAFAQAPQGLVNGLRGPTPLAEEGKPAPLPKTINDDQRRARSFPAQPPVNPHQTDNYQVDLRFNKCMDCHARSRTQESQAPMVSVTHYQDRDGNFLGAVSPRRYVCLACHVPQTTAAPLVENRFTDMDALAEPERQPERGRH